MNYTKIILNMRRAKITKLCCIVCILKSISEIKMKRHWYNTGAFLLAVVSERKNIEPDDTGNR